MKLRKNNLQYYNRCKRFKYYKYILYYTLTSITLHQNTSGIEIRGIFIFKMKLICKTTFLNNTD